MVVLHITRRALIEIEQQLALTANEWCPNKDVVRHRKLAYLDQSGGQHHSALAASLRPLTY